ncbi:unnamed protein product [Polarella glacialis]|uniref:Uncharacterized protein n=1 Tax=Polarella glacialis TaxID=89957 RepID=A0A813DU79_POLGL|nr:unnamed protein product [Polarella glacialis]CAE8658155.1 unnamed protein product [Polarella glacialis]
MRSDANINSDVEAAMKVGGAMRAPQDESKVYLITTSGFRITIDGASKTGTIEMENGTFPISDDWFSRRLQDENAECIQDDAWMKCESSVTCLPKTPPKGWHRRLQQRRKLRGREAHGRSQSMSASGSFVVANRAGND